ncbi:hypothetical protein N4T57_07350 [Campylobacter hepaticus]|uniref:DUF541 domain-containing protein n=1 Tax=Campylobacter hepaticus TaxID=1813019 RepID=A0A424Z1G3_9BACT|nr:hypothetical protein [Campylobacter hepaticus]AXP09322.1 hypothetical protein A2J15_006615 [Campylobacter hepaticus]MCZ0772933.1 hypothetical protein [Campylobacter hepaticus]MCZ0774402.1 hypothetical protein [Campylobacter hepaticus]MCZ0775654.1 hypothetical protein [Campylobacter hepaticus]MDX2323560.1 hypothetical protein [Campylobacter hepaticus]
MLAFLKGLGIGFLCLLLFVAGVIFNVEFLNKEKSNHNLYFSRNIEVSNTLKPDLLYANINFWANENLSSKITLSKDEKAQIANTFNEIIKRTQKENFCQGGSFDLNPNFSYQEGAKILKGQTLHANLICEFKENQIQDFNKMLNDIDFILEKNIFIGVSTPAIKTKFSKDILNKNKEKLYKELLHTAYSYEKTYSLDLNKTCTLKNLQVNNYINTPLLNTKSNNIELSSPIIHEKEQILSAKALFVCK